MPKNPALPLSAVNKGAEWAILTGKSPYYTYQGGQKTSSEPTGWKIDVLLQGNCFSPLTVKLNQTNDPLPSVSQEMIETACASVEPIFVTFTNCVVTFYAIDHLRMSATAEKVALAKIN